MKLKTRFGTQVEIISIAGCGLVNVTVHGRSGIAQVAAVDLVVPDQKAVPPELAEVLKHSPATAKEAKVPERTLPVEEPATKGKTEEAECT